MGKMKREWEANEQLREQILDQLDEEMFFPGTPMNLTEHFVKLNEEMLDQSFQIHNQMKEIIDKTVEQIKKDLSDTNISELEKQQLIETFVKACWNRNFQGWANAEQQDDRK